MTNPFDAEIARRKAWARQLARQFPTLAATADYAEFLRQCEAAGLELDFITSTELWDALTRET